MRTGTLALGAVLLLAGCFDQHGSLDGGAPRDGTSRDGDSWDAGLADGEIADGFTTPCPTIGGYDTCGELCDDWCPGDGLCIYELGICEPFPEAAGCGVDRVAPPRPESPHSAFCPDSRVCAGVRDAEGFGGRCVNPSFCAEAPAAGVDATCFYSDGTEYDRGPATSDTCPPSNWPNFCGGPCDACRRRDGRIDPIRATCAGINETRGFGVCSLGAACHLGNTSCGIEFGEPCACLLLRGADGELPEVGFTTLASACLAYRGHFPDGVECYDFLAWTPLP